MSSPHSSLTALTTSDVISYSRRGGWDWKTGIQTTVSCIQKMYPSYSPVCLNSIYSIITFGKLIKTLVWPGSGLLVSVNRDASGDMMIENAPGYLDAWSRDINTDERRDTEACLTLSAL